jgi:manganese/iron transport system permease protein
MRQLVDSFQSPLFRRAVLEAVLIGALAGAVGVHVVLRRLPFFVVAMSHATFPGVAIASVLGVSLFLGGTTFGLLVVAAVLLLGTSAVLDSGSVIGVVLGGSFALGVLVVSATPGSSRDLSAFLVGSVLTVTPADIATTIVVGVVVLLVLGGLHKELILGAFDRRGAAALGYRAGALDAVVLAAVTVTMVASIPSVGTLLAVALLTVPALTARLWVERVVPMMVLAATIGAVSGLVGLCAAAVWSVAAGASIALTTGVCFLASLALTTAAARWRHHSALTTAPAAV